MLSVRRFWFYAPAIITMAGAIWFSISFLTGMDNRLMALEKKIEYREEVVVEKADLKGIETDIRHILNSQRDMKKKVDDLERYVYRFMR